MSREMQLERLIELISNISNVEIIDGGEVVRLNVEEIADHLLDSGIIVPLVKAGDKVYAVSDSRIVECTCIDITIGAEERIITEHNCNYDCKGCPFDSWGQDYSGERSCQGEYGTWDFAFDDIGKTVFLEKSEAEKKLKENNTNAE